MDVERNSRSILITIFVSFLIILSVSIAGCSSNQPTVASETTIPPTTIVSGQAVTYNTTELITGPGSTASRFKMDYPSEWTYIREQTPRSSLASLIKNGSEAISTRDQTKNWKAIFNFFSSDDKSHAYVYFDDYSGSTYYWYPIDTWANATITAFTKSYCIDDTGNPKMEEKCSPGQQKFYNRVLISNDPVTIKGSLNARKLVFTSNDDKNKGQYTLYLIHAGAMQGYRYVVPSDPKSNRVKVDGIVWDRGIGGYCYAIEFFTPANQVSVSTDIFNRMINSFEIIK